MELNRLLRLGCRGEDVREVQRALGITADGIYGKNTYTAVKNYQRKNKLLVDGIVGQETWMSLFPPFAASTNTATLGVKTIKIRKAARNVREIIVHCTATKEGNDTTVEAIRKYHVNVRHFADIGYHYVIRLDGTICEGRSVHQAGAHCLGHNSNSIGVCYVGGLDSQGKAKDTRTAQQKAALVWLVKALMETYKLPTSRVYGHYQFANKACPCFKIESFRKELG